MRVAFDATAILGPMSKNRGIGNYSFSQFTTMISIDENNQYFFFNMFDDEFSLNNSFNKSIHVRECKLFSGPDQLIMKEKQYNKIVGEIIKKFLRINKIDVFIITSPFDSCNIMYRREWFAECKVVAIVYDIIPYVMKERYLADKTTYSWYMECIDMLRWVDEIQVISQSVKDDLVTYLHFDEKKISVIWGGVDKRYEEIEISEGEKTAIYKKFGLKDEFIMCTGGDDERKNLAGLIEAYANLPCKLINECQLAIVCKLSKEAVNRYTKLIAELGVEGRVVLTNFVSNEELLVLYNEAKLMAFPSLYEGFGLPVVEAWACGTPVLTSNNSSLVQIAGDGAIIVNPEEIEDITRGLEYALTECDLTELLKKGKKRLELFRWEKVAVASIYSIEKLKAAENKQVSRKERKKIAVFTPLPPLQSGISDYSVDIINALSRYYNIDVYIDRGYEPNISFEKTVNILSHKLFEKHCNEYSEILYQVGNSIFHLYMYDYIKKHSGIVVLHDYNMHGVFIHNSLGEGKGDYRLYEKYLLEDYSQSDVKEYIQKLKNNQCGYKMHEWEANGVITNYAKKIIVHSFEAKEKLLRKDIRRNVKQIWSFVNFENKLSSNKSELKKRKGYSEECILFAAFGHVHETKRIIPIIKAFYELIQEFKNVRLIFVGKLDENLQSEFNKTLKECGIDDYVKVTGYTSLEEFEEYISATDVCLNLRYPYNGETSASLIRNLAKGNIVITNDIGSFGEIPDTVCIKIPNVATISQKEEIEQIHNAMVSCIVNPERCKVIKNNAEEFAKKHLDVIKAAEEYANYIEEEDIDTINEKLLKELSCQLAEVGCGRVDTVRVAHTLTWLKENSEEEVNNISKVCCEKDFEIYKKYINWLPTLQEVYPDFNIPKGIVHRKIWEWAFIISALDYNNMLQNGKRGLGFAVGTEPLPSLFVAKGCEIMATDYWPEDENMWAKTGQNLQGNKEILNRYNLCEKEQFDKKLNVAKVNMKEIPKQFFDFDFCWSSCAIEHLGDIELGKKFFFEHIKVLKAGGISVHTIEFNSDSNEDTLESGETVLFRKRDINEIAIGLEKLGCEVMCSFDFGMDSGDLFIDTLPYYSHNSKYHLHLNVGGYNCTSYGIIIKKKSNICAIEEVRNR